MRQMLSLAVVGLVTLMAMSATAEEPEALARPAAWSLQAGRTIAAESIWSPRGFSAAATCDLPVGRVFYVVISAGGSSGSRFGGTHGDFNELEERHAAVGVRAVSHWHRRLQAFGWAGVGYERAQVRTESWQGSSRSTASKAAKTPAGVLGVGIWTWIREGKAMVVGELTGLWPSRQRPVGEITYPPFQLSATFGVRFLFHAPFSSW